MDLTKERNTHRHAKKVMLMHKQPKKEKGVNQQKTEENNDKRMKNGFREI